MTIWDACAELQRIGALATLETVPTEEVVRSMRLQNKAMHEILDATLSVEKRYAWRKHSKSEFVSPFDL